jgi:glucosylceramidase
MSTAATDSYSTMISGHERGARTAMVARYAGLIAILATLLLTLSPAGAHAASTLTEYQTTGYQPLGYSATAFAPTTSAGSSLLSPVTAPAVTTAGITSGTLLTVDPAETYQTMLGYGATLNDSGAYLLTDGLTPATLATSSGINAVAGSPAMEAMFSPSEGIGLSYIRVSIGGNDFAQANYASSPSLANDYVENDPAPGSTATSFGASTLSNFISHDQAYLIPVLKAAIQDNPSMRITASAWTAPGWMKCENYEVQTAGAACQAFATTGANPGFAGGALNPADEAQYADYLLEFILAYKAQGLTIDSVSLGNEPMNENFTYPSMIMIPAVEAAVAADLKADLTTDGLPTQIIGLDHNWNTVVSTSQPSGDCSASSCYANQLLDDATSGTVNDIGYHCYGGDPSVQSSITAGIMETECSTQGYYSENASSSVANPYTTEPASFAASLDWDTGYLEILAAQDGDTGGVSGDGSQTAMLWNLAGDNDYGITINSGCLPSSDTTPCLPVGDVSDAEAPVPEVGYYILGQLSKFVQPGAVRIGSTNSGDLYSVAFEDPNGATVLVVLDTSGLSCSSTTCTAPSSRETFTVQESGQQFISSITPDTVQTYTW